MPESTNNFRSVIINRNPPTGNLFGIPNRFLSSLSLALVSYSILCSQSLCVCWRTFLTLCRRVLQGAKGIWMNNCSSSAVLIISHHSFLSQPCTSSCDIRYPYGNRSTIAAKWLKWERTINVKQTRHHDYTICSNGCLDYVIVNISINKRERVDFFFATSFWFFFSSIRLHTCYN